MYVCYYTYPGGSHHTPTLTAAPQAATIPATEPLLVPATQPALPPQTGIPTLGSHIPITVCRKVRDREAEVPVAYLCECYLCVIFSIDVRPLREGNLRGCWGGISPANSLCTLSPVCLKLYFIVMEIDGSESQYLK
jgi:hypothetical protein